MILCSNCENTAVFLIADLSANEADYCRPCLPANQVARANAGQLLDSQTTTDRRDPYRGSFEVDEDAPPPED